MAEMLGGGQGQPASDSGSPKNYGKLPKTKAGHGRKNVNSVFVTSRASSMKRIAPPLQEPLNVQE